MAQQTRRGGSTKRDARSKSSKDTAVLATRNTQAGKRITVKDELPHSAAKKKAPAKIAVQIGAHHRYVAIDYRSIAASSPSEKSTMVRKGLSTAFVKHMASDLAIEQSVLTDSMGIARSTFTRKAKNQEALSTAESAVVLGMARIVGEIERILAESGDPEQMKTFDVAEWVGTWLREPVPSLGGRPPLDFMDNTYGQETVLQLVGQMQSGAFA